MAHGSARSGDSAEPVLALAEALRDRGFPEVQAAFWKEEPFLHQAIETTRSAVVAVLPVFLAEGYFTRTVVPRELGLRYGANEVDGRRFELLPPLGTSTGLDAIVLARANEALPASAPAAEAALVLLGHGTPRDPGSADAVLDSCARLERANVFARVAPAFIDQEPRLEDVIRETIRDMARDTAHLTEASVVVVPFLVSAGWHGGTTVPEELARTAAERVHYAEPVGTHPSIAELAETLLLGVDAAGAPDPPSALARAESALRGRLAAQSSIVLLQAACTSDERGTYDLRHVDDLGERGLRYSRMTEITDVARLGEIARRTEDGSHRPLRTAADLPRGWRLRARSVRELTEALVELYGPALVDWHLGESGAMGGASFRETAARQSGIYAALTRLEPAAVRAAIRRTCDGIPCLRTRLWEVDDAAAGASSESPAEESKRLVVPCPRPCPILLSSALDPAGAEPSGAAPERGVDDPGGRG